MAQTNFTPILIYGSGTTGNTPLAANLTSSAAGAELALNYFDGKLFYKDNAGVVQVLATKATGTIGGTNTQVQYNNGGALAGSANLTFNGTTLTANTLNLTNALTTAYGGTGITSYAAGDLPYYAAGTTLSKLTIGTNGQVLTSSGTAPQWTNGSSITVGTATNLAGGVAGSLPYQTGANTTTFLGIGAANRVLTSTGTAPQWVTSLTGLTGVSSSGLTNTSLTSGRVVYSTTGGAQTDSANLTFDGSTLTVNTVQVGLGSGSVTTNVGVGNAALAGNTTGSQATALGYAALYNQTTGVANTAVGYNAARGAGTGVVGNYNTAVGNAALSGVSTGSDNTAFGFQSLYNHTTGSNNTSVGSQAGYNNTSAADNVFVGYRAAFTNSTGTRNTAIGTQALYTNTTSNDSTALGYRALYVSTGANNTAVGSNALSANTTGGANIGIGSEAGYSNQTGVGLIAIGYRAAYSSTASMNVAIGYRAMRLTTSGTRNIAIGGNIGGDGTSTLESNVTSQDNIAIGFGALYSHTTNSNNIAIGTSALGSDVSGNENTAIGSSALGTNSSGQASTAVGFAAGVLNTTGGSLAFFGHNAGTNNTTGSFNVAVGRQALYSNTTASNNTAVGYQAAYSNTTGTENVAVGYQAAYSSTTAGGLTAIGRRALFANTGGPNVAIGYHTLIANTTGTHNIAIGANDTSDGTSTLDSNTTGRYNVAIGMGALTSNTTADQSVAIGYSTLYSSNRTADANAQNTAIGAQAGFGVTTGQRNTLVGSEAGYALTTGSNNSILGRFNGNQGGLDIRTSSNNIVLSDGDGNPRQIIDGSGNVGIGTAPSAWGGTTRVLQLGTRNSSLVADTGSSATYLLSNAYFDGTNWLRSLATGAAYYTVNGTSSAHSWQIAPSGAAGSTITWTTAMTLNSSGGLQTLNTIGVGNATPAASGAGVTFPATQSASSDANTLDDYEEGTWTPTWVFGTSGSAVTIYTYATYTKVGRAVNIRVQIYSQAFSSGTGDVSIGGLPFTSSNASGNDFTAVAVALVDSWTTDMPNLKASIANNATTIRLSKNASNAAIAYVQGSDMNVSDGKNGIVLSGTYFV